MSFVGKKRLECPGHDLGPHAFAVVLDGKCDVAIGGKLDAGGISSALISWVTSRIRPPSGIASRALIIKSS